MTILAREAKRTEMKKKLNVKVTRIIRTSTRLPDGLKAHCSKCGGEVEIIGVAQATEFLRAPQSELDSMIFAGLVHAITAINGYLWICKKSLFQERT